MSTRPPHQCTYECNVAAGQGGDVGVPDFAKGRAHASDTGWGPRAPAGVRVRVHARHGKHLEYETHVCAEQLECETHIGYPIPTKRGDPLPWSL